MDINKLCPGCMREVEDRDQTSFCPHCGYDFKNPQVSPHQLQPFSILKGKYVIGRVIGEGGFGITYLGYDLMLEIPVAIKEFYPNGFVTREANVTPQVTIFAGNNAADIEKWRNGFIKEARSLAKFTNLEGIVKVQEFFNENETAYIVMEYVDGITVKSYLKQNGGKLPVEQVLQMMKPVIQSLAKVHETGIIHRDISPDNIMITSSGGMKLLDFGAARDVSGAAEKSLSVMLKPGYAPEEQYRTRGNQGSWSDVYALCATIYKCISGITPVESMERMRNDSLKRPSELGIMMEPYQEEALMAGMAVYAENRIQNMSALHDMLYTPRVVQSPLVMNTNTPSMDDSVTVPLTTAQTQYGTQTQYGSQTQYNAQPQYNVQSESNQTNKGMGTGAKAAIGGIAAVVCILIVVLCVVFLNKDDKDSNVAVNDSVESSVIEKEEAHDKKEEKEDIASILPIKQGLTEEQMAKLDEIGAKAAQDASYTNLKDVLDQYYTFASENDALEEVAERAGSVFDSYQNAVLEHVSLLEQQDTLPSMYIQMKLELDEAIQLAQKYGEIGISFDYALLEDKLSTLSVDYKARLINNFDNKAYEQINGNGVISRSALWPLMENANETGLYNDEDVNDPLRLRYIAALTYHTDSEIDNLDNVQAANKIYEVLEETDYSPLLLYYLAERYNEAEAYEWYYSVNNILSAYVGDFASLSLSEKRNYIFYYNSLGDAYNTAREEVRKYMEQNR